jgi:hypothetical protein
MTFCNATHFCGEKAICELLSEDESPGDLGSAGNTGFTIWLNSGNAWHCDASSQASTTPTVIGLNKTDTRIDSSMKLLLYPPKPLFALPQDQKPNDPFFP